MMFSLFSAFNALISTFFNPGYLSFPNFVVDFFILSHEMGYQVLLSHIFAWYCIARANQWVYDC